MPPPLNRAAARAQRVALWPYSSSSLAGDRYMYLRVLADTDARSPRGSKSNPTGPNLTPPGAWSARHRLRVRPLGVVHASTFAYDAHVPGHDQRRLSDGPRGRRGRTAERHARSRVRWATLGAIRVGPTAACYRRSNRRGYDDARSTSSDSGARAGGRAPGTSRRQQLEQGRSRLPRRHRLVEPMTPARRERRCLEPQPDASSWTRGRCLPGWIDPLVAPASPLSKHLAATGSVEKQHCRTVLLVVVPCGRFTGIGEASAFSRKQPS
jgi:hypothetical protein